MAFQGSLQELPLPDILQLVAVSGKSGSFTIQRGRDTGRIFLSDGQIVHAVLGQLEGEEAVYELAIWTEGEFVFDPDGESVPTTIDKSNTSLLMEAARRIDEWKVLSKKVQSTRLVPVFAEGGGRSSVSLSPAEWAVIRRIDGRRSIDEIARAIGTSPFETAKVLYGLITGELVELTEDVERLPIARLGEMDPEELRAVARAVHREVMQLVAGHDATGQLIKGVDERLSACEATPAAKPVVELIRTGEKAVSVARGPHQARAFLDSVDEIARLRRGTALAEPVAGAGSSGARDDRPKGE